MLMLWIFSILILLICHSLSVCLTLKQPRGGFPTVAGTM